MNRNFNISYRSIHFTNVFLAFVAISFVVRTTNAANDENPLLISGTGATFPAEVYESWISAYESTRREFETLDMTYAATGSLIGKLAIQDKPTEYLIYSGTDSELTPIEYVANPDIHMVPVLGGPVVLAFNIPIIDYSLNLTREHIVGIYNGTYRMWNDSSIRAINPKAALPEREIRVVARADYSGTTEVFTASLCIFDQNWNETYGAFPEGLDHNDQPIVWNTSVIDLYGRLNRGVSGLILSFWNSIGYLSIADAVASELTLISILDENGKVVTPNFEDVRKAMDRSSSHLDEQLTADLSVFTEPGEYPIIGFSYLIIRMSRMSNCQQAVELARYIEWTFADNYASELIVHYRMSAVTPAVGERIMEDVLGKMTCGTQNESVWTLVEEQKHAEYLAQQTWRLPVMIAVPIAGVAILAMVIYMIVQQVRLKKAMLSDDWHINSDSIFLNWSKKHGFMSDKNGPGSALSLSMSVGSNISVTAGPSVWAIGAWGDKSVCLREIPPYSSFNIQNNETRRTLLWLKYKVHHTNILHIHGVVFMGNELFLVSEHAPKGTLSDVVQNDKYRIDDNIKFALAMDVASGMAFLHGLGILHGHLCSETCFIDSRWNVKITDWEFNMIDKACQKKSHSRKITPDISIAGTHTQAEDPNREARALYFVDPTLIKMTVYTPCKTGDMYSFAMIMVEIFTRDDPYTELSAYMEPVQIIEAIKENDIRPGIKDLSPVSMRAIIVSAWDSDSLKRPTFTQLKKALKGARHSKKSVMDSLMEVLEGYVNQLEEKVAERTAALASANSNLENLLHQILPPSVADSLTRGEAVQPEAFDMATIFFSDIVGFTKLSSSSSPMEIVAMLNDLYTCFDAIIDDHDVYKVETIGDAYMCISGLPNRNGNLHASHICAMALELIAAACKFKIGHRPEEKLSLRAGIHTGPVVSGVVGLKMPRYCLFGDTVNTASRMESTSVAMKIQISQTTYTLLQAIGGFKTEPRGEIEVKGKGTMKTFFLISRDQPKVSSVKVNGSDHVTPRDVGVLPKFKGQIDVNERAISFTSIGKQLK